MSTYLSTYWTLFDHLVDYNSTSLICSCPPCQYPELKFEFKSEKIRCRIRPCYFCLSVGAYMLTIASISNCITNPSAPYFPTIFQVPTHRARHLHILYRIRWEPSRLVWIQAETLVHWSRNQHIAQMMMSDAWRSIVCDHSPSLSPKLERWSPRTL